MIRVDSKISAIVANQLGRMQGALEAQIQEQINQELGNFVNQCPNPDQLIRTVEVRNSLLNVINLFEDKTTSFSRYSSNLNNTIAVLNTILTIIRNIPIPTAVPPGIGVPIALTNKYAEILFDLRRFLESIENDSKSVDNLVNSVTPFISLTRTSLERLDERILNCIENLKDKDQDLYTDILETVRNNLDERRNQESRQTGNGLENIRFVGENGKIYFLSVVTTVDRQTNIITKRAIAKNNNGVIVIRGPKSFSSDSKVLIDELKFRINNQLP